MGFYNGNGITTSGGEIVSVFGTLVYNGAHIVLQKTVSEVTRKAGVSYQTATSEHASTTLYTKTFQWANSYPWVGCYGTKKEVSYSKISDSNLFELNITNSTMTASGDGGTTWVTS